MELQVRVFTSHGNVEIESNEEIIQGQRKTKRHLLAGAFSRVVHKLELENI